VNLVELVKDFALVCLIFVPLERAFALRRGQGVFRHGWGTDLLHVFITGILTRVGSALLIVSIAGLFESLVPEPLRAAVAQQPAWLALIEVIIIADLGFYFVHRAFHAIPWLWRFHAIHHSIEEMDFLAAHRVHPVDQILTRGATMIPIFVLGFAPEPMLLFSMIYHWQSILIHSNTRIGAGPMRWIIVSPLFHHWHHANHPEAIDKNFAGQLSVIDVIFGTLHMPHGETPRMYGTDHPVPKSYIGQIVQPFRREHGATAAE